MMEKLQMLTVEIIVDLRSS